MKCNEETNTLYDEPLLSFGDDTIAAINQLEISRLVNDLSPKQQVNLKNTSLLLSQNRKVDLHLSPATKIQTSIRNKENNSELNASTAKSLSPLCTQQKCDLALWGLPDPVLQQYEAHGIKLMFPWQVECLSHEDVLEGRNLVYSAPTSAGKTLVAELLTIKAVLEKKKKAVIILPFVSVVREKMFYFKSLLETSGVRVEGLMGGHTVHGGIKNVDIAVCTIEKANGLINRLMEEDSLQRIGIVVVDELHLLGDPFRGYLLELLITKIRYMSTMNDDVNIQIVGMSATLPNLDLLASWLDARLYKTDFRPIPLNEYLKVGSRVFTKNLEVKRTLESKYNIQDDSDHVVYLCLETVLNGYSSLIFCPTKNWCEKLAISIAKEFFRIGSDSSDIGLKLREQLKSEAIAEALEQLKACPVGLDHALAKSIAFGVAFHHAGLTIDERDIIEGLFRSGVIRVLTATSTLSSGVNLPARRVLIRTPVFHRKPLDVQVYKQMVGRAGRMGKDSEGESFLLCNKSEQKVGEELIQDGLRPIESCLGHGELSSSLKRAILEVIASGVAETPEQLACYTNCTLLATSHVGLENPIESCVKFLVDSECIRLQLTEDKITKYIPTPLGNACLAASMSPDDGLELFQELQKARQCFVLENELHLIYLVTPFSVSAQWGNLDWLQIMSLWEKLPPSMRRVGSLVGVDDAFMVRALRGTINLQSYKQLHKLSVHRRFYTALALQELVNEVPLVEVAAKFQCSKGMLQSLQQTSATFAGMVTAFCKRLGWRNLELLVSQFQDRLQFGVHRELCELMRLDLLNGPRARALFNAGITSLGDLASADICQVENALHKSVTFQTSKEMEGETAYDAAYRNQLKTIWITGRQGLTEREAAELLIKEARVWLQQELGLVDVKWGNNNDETNTTSHNDTKHSNSVSVKEDSRKMNPDDSELNNLKSLTPNTSANLVELDALNKNGVRYNSKNQTIICESEDEILYKSDHETTQQEPGIDKEVLDNSSNTFCPDDPSNSALKLYKNELNNHEKADTHNLENVENQLKANIVVKESQPSNCDSDDDTLKVSSNPQSNVMISPKSPFDDIFDTSQEDTDLNVGVMLSKNNSVCSVKEGDVSLPLANTATIINSPDVVNLSKDNSQETNYSLHEKSNLQEPKNDLQETHTADVHGNKSTSSYDTSRACSRHSLDVFASPVSVTCKSPTIFDDSLIIDSHLGNLLDDNCKGSSKMLENENKNEVTYNITNIALLSKNPDKNKALQSPKNLLPPAEKGYPLIEQNVSFKDISSDSKNTVFSYNHEGKSGLLLDKRCTLISEKKCEKNNINYENVLKKNTKNAIVASSIVDGITDSFLKQAFTTICDFGNGTKSDSLIEQSLPKFSKENTDETPKKFYHVNKINSVNFNDKEIIVLSNEKLKERVSRESLEEAKILPDAQDTVNAQDNSPFSTKCKRQEKDGDFQDTGNIRKKLSFVSDSEEDENDLVPSSQSQSDASSYQSSSCNSVTWRKKQNEKKLSPLKRKRIEERYDPKQVQGDAVDLATKKIKTQGNTSWDSFKVIDVCAERKIFEEFTRKLKSCSHIAFSVACEKWLNDAPKPSIGDNILRRKSKKKENVRRLLVNDKCHVVGIGVCLGDKETYFIALDPDSRGDGSQGLVSFGEQLDLVERLMTSEEKYILSAFDMKEQYKALYKSCSVNIDKEVYDPKVADWLLDSECDEKGLRPLITKYIPDSLKLTKRVGNITGVRSLGLQIRSPVRARMRACVEAVTTWHIISAQWKKLEESNLLKIYKDVEMPTVMCLARMEVYGIGFCREEAEKLHTLFQKQLEDLEQEAFKLANHSFSLSSPNDVAKIILPFLKVGMSERIFGCYETHTVTGRITMHEPNLQSIPRDFDISLRDGDNMTVSLRMAFIPKTGKSFISADYSQLELRILAHLSQDRILLNILSSGGDVFRSVAASWNHIAEHEVTDSLRQRAKQVCYGVIYGIGANALSDQLEVDEEEAALFMESFLAAYPGLKAYRDDVIKKCKAKCFVETLSGRKRFLPAINSNKPHLRAQAERQALNTTVQGSAADIAKTAMVLVEASLKAVFRNESPRIRRLRENKRQCIEMSIATLILHLHDELLYEVCDEYIDDVIQIVKGGMEAAANLTVPLPVKVKCGKSWGSLEEVL
ncbi:hypothetical protein R5R35_008130 [Gryllus longicercus]|uniref:DNA polymerase theta n=1 Tax=Gryllus longicercus TaxID=2509291 RepID=A0AAN9VGK5_9ORTH